MICSLKSIYIFARFYNAEILVYPLPIVFENIFHNLFFKRSAFTILQQYVIKRRMKQRLNWIAVQHRARMVLKCFLYSSNSWIDV